MQGIRAKIDYILKHNVIISKIFRVCMSLALKILGIFIPINDKAVIFSGHSRKYNDSPRVIYERMINDPLFNDYTYIWALDDPDKTEIPGECIKIKSDTLKYFAATLKCKYWISCVNIERSLKYKKKKTLYLNTWHGTPLKTIGNAAAGRKDFDFSHIDFFCSAGEYEKEIYIRDFQLRPESIINTGLPRNDELYDVTPDEINEIRKKLNIPEDKKVILYAPTWRDSADKGDTYAIKPPMDMDKWKRNLSGEFVLMFRTHPYTNKLLGIQFDDFVRDYTQYPNLNDLLKISDILISDYSAVIFDYSILERPVFCFGYDYEMYSKVRGLYVDLNECIPGGVIETEDEIIEKILTCDYERESAGIRTFKNKFLQYGGHAAEECMNVLFDISKK